MNNKFFAALLCVALTSCGGDKPSVPAPADGGAQTLVSTDGLGWKTGDQIAVFNGLTTQTNCATALYECTAVDGTNATFSFVKEGFNGSPEDVDDEAETYVAVYPFREDYSFNEEECSISWDLPSKRGSVVVNPRFSAETEKVLFFEHAFGVLRICITGSRTLSSLRLEGSKPLSGKTSISLGMGHPEVGDLQNASNAIEVEFEGGLSLTTARSSNIDILLPPSDYGTLSLRLLEADGTFMDTTLESITITRGKTRSKTVVYEEPAYEPWKESGKESMTYICNGEIQAGIDLARGGCIFHLSDAEHKKNVLNYYDAGRYVQQSYYGDLDGSDWNGTAWTYNPVQGGGWKSGYNSQVTSSNVRGTHIECTTIPTHWATCQPLPECEMKEEISLEGKVLHVHYSFTYSGSSTYKSRHQELPAVFCNLDYKNLVYYNGSNPWKGEELTTMVPDNMYTTKKNQYLEGNAWAERWAAYVDDNGYGVGVYTPVSTLATLYRYEAAYKPSSCTYIAPLGVFAITPGLVKTYDVYMTLGTADEIRARFKSIRDGK